MAETDLAVQSPSQIAKPAQTAQVLRSRSYPRRIHVRERPEWNALLQSWEARITEAASQRSARTDQGTTSKLYAQMLGARDQLADAVRRLPMEVGELYEEDRHRVNLAVAALERLFAQWNG